MDLNTIPVEPAQLSLKDHLQFLGLPFMHENSETLADQAGREHWAHVQYLERLIIGEIDARLDRSIQRKIRLAWFPTIKTLEQFQWSWLKKINRLAVQNLFRLRFIEQKANVILLGGVGLGKTHLATALGYQACLKSHGVLFASAVDVINSLAAAQAANRLKSELRKYLSPSVLILDELGYLPIDKRGADLLFQIISQRHERGALIITSNRAFKNWPEIFNNDSTLTSAVLDRLLHHAETIVIEGKSYRMKDQIQD